MATTITSNEGYNSSVSPDPIPEFKPSSFAENDSFEMDLLRPSIEAEKKYQEEGLEIRRKNYETVKKHTLDFDNFEPEQTSEVRNRVLVSGYLDSQFRDEDRPSNDHDILRDAVAQRQFGGAGVGSDEAFVSAIRQKFEGDNENRAFYDELDRKAVLSAFMGGGAPKQEFQKLSEGNPIARSERREINERWQQNIDAIEDEYGASMLFDIRTTYNDIKSDPDSWLMHAARRTRGYSDEEKTQFISALRDIATAYPSEVGSTFGGNFAKSTRRGVGGALDKGSEAAMEFFRNAAVGAHNTFITPWPQVFGGNEGKQWAEDHKDAGKAWLKEERDAVDFEAELRDVFEQDYAPTQPLAPKDSTRRAVEEGVYAIPGAITTSAVAFIPVVGMPLSFGMMKEFDREKYRREILADGGSRDDAYRLAGGMSMVSAVPNMLLEKFQSYGLAGKVPGMGKVFGKIDDIFANKVGRFGTKMFVAGAAETAVELTQHANTDLVQDITSSFEAAVPGIEWKNGKDGHFDGYFNKTLTTFVAVAPLGVIVAGRGLTQESRAEAMKKASPLERKAFGITEEASARIDAAKTPREMVEAFSFAVKTREPFSDTAQESVMELEEMHRMRTQTNEDAETFGVSPSVRKTPDKSTFEVFDRLTGDTLAEVDTAQEATEEVFHQLQMKEEESRQYFQELLASFEAAALDVEQSGEAVEVGTGTFTDADAEAAMPGSDRRLQTERELVEQRDGGTGAVAQEVMSEGQSGQIAGVYVPAGKMGRKEAVTQLHNSASVLTLIHERGHAKRLKLMASGAWTRADQISSLRGLDNLIAKADEKFLPENLEELSEYDQEVAIDEAVAELSEVLALNSRKGKNSKMGGFIARNLSAMVQARIPGAAQLKSFLGSMRAFFGLQLRRATILRKAVRDGNLDQTQVDQLTDMLVGTNSQEVFEQARDAIPTEMVDGQQVDTPFSTGKAGLLSLGNTTVTPNADTKTYPTKDGGVVGPASFSITAHHGTPHKVGKFSAEKIGTGEGAQAYGWGLYFAGSEGVAKGYFDKFQGEQSFRMEADGAILDVRVSTPQEVSAARKVEELGVKGAKDYFNRILSNKEYLKGSGAIDDFDIANHEAELGFVGSLPAGLTDVKLVEDFDANLYTVELNVEQDELLDWDKKLSEQSELVREALRTSGYVSEDTGWFEDNGQDIYINFGGSSYFMGAEIIGKPKQASEALAALGIKGIRYLDGDSRADGEGTSNYVIFNDADIKITEENGQVVDTSSPSFSITPKEIREAKEPIVEQIYLKETEKFKQGVESGRIKTDSDIRDFIGKHMVMHQPDTAMAGEVRVDGESFVKGKGGVYYPVLFSEEGYFWASTAAKADEMAGALNEISERNGGSIYMALTSADVDKLFSSTTMSVGTMNFFKQLATNPRKYGITEAQLNKMLIEASKTQIVSKLLIKGEDGKPVLNEKGEKTYKVKTQEFGHTLSKGSKLNQTMQELEGWLQPFNEDKSTGSSFDVRKSFVFDLMRQVSAHLKGKPAQSKAVASLLTQESNEFAKNKVIKGDLSLAAFTQGLGDMLSEPLTKTFQQFGSKGKGYIYAVIEIEGKVKAIDTKGHESYPKAIVSAEGKLPTVHVMKEGYHWTDVVQEKDSGARVERVTKEMNKVYPTGGFSAYKGRPLQFGDVQENAEGVELSFSPGDSRMLSDLSENVMRRVRAPEARAVVFERLVDRIDALKRDVSKMIFGGTVEQEALPDARSMKSLKKEAAFRQADLRKQYQEDKAKRPVERARTEANEWLEEQVAQQKKYYNPVARIRRSLVMYDAILKTLPPELRGKMGGFVQIAKLNSDQKRLEFLQEKVEQLDKEVDKWISGKHREQIEKIFKANRPKKKSSGPSKVNSNFKHADLVMKIEKLSKLTREEVEAKILKIDGKLETETDEAEIQRLTEKRDNLAVFGNIDGMKANALGDFYQNLNTIHRQGKLLKAMSDEQFNQFLEETIEIVNNDVTGGRGDLNQSDAKLLKDARRKRKINLKYIGAENIELQGMSDFHRKNLSFEWLLNNISRGNKEAETMKSKTHERLATMVHLSTTREDRANLETQEQYREMIGEMFGVKAGGQLSIGTGIEDVIAELERIEETNISKMEYGKDGRSSAKRLPASKVQAILNGEATIEALGISESDWAAIQVRYAEIKESGKNIKDNTRVEYESQTEGEAKMMALSQSQAINLTMLWRQEGLRGSMKHEGYSEQTMKDMEAFLSPESKRLREWLTMQYEENYHKINQVFRAQNGFSLPKTDFYSPAVRIAEREAKDMSIDSEGRQAMSVDPAFTITRTANKAPMDQNAGALSIYVSHTLQTNHYTSWADTVKTLRSVFSDRTLRDNIKGYVGSDALRTLEERIQWFADGGNRKATHIEWMDKLRMAHTYNSLAFKWAIAVKQLTSLPAYAFDMGFGNFAKYGARWLKHPVKNMLDMWESDYVQTRFKKGYERDVIDGLRSKSGANKFKKALQVGMLSGKLGDIVPVMMGGWIAREHAYDQAKRDGMTDADAKRKAEIVSEMVSDRSQQAGGMKDLSTFQGDGSMFKLFTMYKTSPRQYYANVYESGLDMLAGKKGSKKQFSRRFVISHMLLPLTFQFVSDITRMGLRPDDDDTFSGENYLRAMLLGPLNGLFIAGDMLDIAISSISGAKVWEKKIPILDGVMEVSRGVVGAVKGDDFEEVADDLIRGIGKMTPGAFTFYDIITDEYKRIMN